MTVKFLLSYFISVFAALTGPADQLPPKVYPVPPINEHSLFYIQRSKNTNAIVYEANFDSLGKINEIEPIKVYWIRYSSDSTTEGLTMIQKKYAYGVTARPYNGQKNSFVIQFVAYKKKNIFLLPNANGKYSAFISVNGKFIELKKIFISITGGTFWFPTIDYIEVSGKEPSTQKVVVEKFKP